MRLGTVPRRARPAATGAPAARHHDIGLDPIPRRTLQPRRRRDQATDALPSQEPGQTEPSRSRLIGHRHRPRQPLKPRESRHDPGITGARTLPGLPVQPHATTDRACTSNPTWYDSPALGPPTSAALPARAPPARQPTITCGEAPARTSIPSNKTSRLGTGQRRTAVQDDEGCRRSSEPGLRTCPGTSHGPAYRPTRPPQLALRCRRTPSAKCPTTSLLGSNSGRGPQARPRYYFVTVRL